jgi:4-hydroxybenzoate polyprenyltransferase
MSTVKKYLSLVKFSHTIFAMPFAMIGFFLGWQAWKIMRQGMDLTGTHFKLPLSINLNEIAMKFILVILCMVFARSAAMAFNRYLDRHFDARNPRTAIREIPSGIIRANNALLFVLLNCIAFIICCWFINRLCFYLSFIALFTVLFYSYTKRFTALCHLVLGVGLSLAPIGAYLAVTGKFDLLPLLFSFAVLCWVSGFDIIYALQDEQFDRENNLHSIPAALGAKKALRVSEVLHILSASSISAAGNLGHFGWFYWIGAGIFTGMLMYQHSVVKPNDLRRVNLAFMTANGIASVVFAIFVLMDMFI